MRWRKAAPWMTRMKNLFLGLLIFSLLFYVYWAWRPATQFALVPSSKQCTQPTYQTRTLLKVVPANYSAHLALVQLVIQTSPTHDTHTAGANGKEVRSGGLHAAPNGSKNYQAVTVARSDSFTIAIALGITSSTLDPDMSHDEMSRVFPTFTQLLPSFCHTVSCGYNYRFYFAYDVDDAFFIQEHQRQMFISQFRLQVQRTCPQGISVDIIMLRCYHSRHPAWAQNDAAYAAYIDAADYVYRVNDDSVMKSADWADRFIQTLRQMNPPNIGVVGPAHTGGAINILTYDFTHKSHIEIFGFQYPRLFIDWSGDSWITCVYKPGRVVKLKTVKLEHSMVLGRRYENHSKAKQLADRLIRDKETLQRYLVAKELHHEMKSPVPSQVIAMSLYGDNYNYTNGAIRNAQLRQVFFPDWTLRIYVPNPCCCDHLVPSLHVQRLLRLGARVIFVNTSQLSISLKHMNLLVALDSTVNRFLIRIPDHRFSERESLLVKEWVRSGENFLMVRDHETQAENSVIAGQYAAVRTWFVQQLQPGILELLVALHKRDTKYLEGQNIKASSSLEDIIWDKISMKDVMYRDSASCTLSHHMYFKPRAHTQESFIGEKFDGFGEVADVELHNILSFC